MSDPDNIGLQDLSNSKANDSRYTTSEKARLVEKDSSQSDNARLRFHVLIVCWVSVISLGILGIVSLVLAFHEDSSASFAFALDALLDCLSSIVVIWRYSGADNTLYSTKREKIACILLGVFFLVSACTIIVRATISLVQDLLPGQSDVLWIVSLVNGITCTMLVMAKGYYAHKLRSVSLATDAVNSAIGAVLAFSTLIGERIYKDNESIWYLDPIISVVCAAFLIVYGVWLIFYEIKYNHAETPPSSPRGHDNNREQ